MDDNHRHPTLKSGRDLYDFSAELYPICRSITGAGVRDTLARIRERIPLTVHEVPTGTPVFDWTIPMEWSIRDAYIKDRFGRRLVDFHASNLHVVGYSVPIHQQMRLSDLRPHLFSLPDHPDWIPYRTSYYKETWGFCVTQRQLERFDDGEEYEVCIDSALAPGSLTYGECMLDGEESDEVLIACHVCHPSLCNDNLSGLVVATALAQELQHRPRRYSYRFLFVPGTIGSITWLSRNESVVDRIRHGLVLACIGDAGPFTYKQSRRGNAEIDQTVAHVLSEADVKHRIDPFSPYGYDERQFCSPGFNLPVGCLMRSPHGEFPEYHTSADNLDVISPETLAESFSIALAVLETLERNRTYLNLNPKCEPQLGKRGLYRAIGATGASREMALLWVLNLSDGSHSLLDISRRSKLPFAAIRDAALALHDHGLLQPIAGPAARPTVRPGGLNEQPLH